MALEIRIIIGPQETAAKRYRLTEEELERARRDVKMYRERQERARQQLIKEGLIPPDDDESRSIA